MTDYPKDVVDERGNVHVLDKVLGEGGQGVVLATNNPDIAVKLISGGLKPTSEQKGTLLERLTHGFGAALVTGDAEHKKLRTRLETVRTLPIPELHLAQPLAMLRGHAGYTMRLLRDMEPIRTLILSAKTENLTAEYHRHRRLAPAFALACQNGRNPRSPALDSLGLCRCLAE